MSFVPAKKRRNGDVIYFGCEKNRTNIAPAQETLKIRLKISQKSLKTLIKSTFLACHLFRSLITEKSTSVNRCAFFNEAHLRCMKNEARLRLMKRALGSRRALRALRFIRAQRVLHGGNAAASCLRSKRFVDKILFLCYNNLNK